MHKGKNMESSSEKRNASNQEKPNVLFVICDDLNNAVAGMGREPCASAPNLQPQNDYG